VADVDALHGVEAVLVAAETNGAGEHAGDEAVSCVSHQVEVVAAPVSVHVGEAPHGVVADVGAWVRVVAPTARW
jgi:hypothetical protein